MSMELFLGLLGFAFVTSVTPGPNNLMLMASGANFGLRRSLPHLLGVSLGHGFLVFLVGLGIGAMVTGWPPARMALKLAAVGYMGWLAWKIATSAPPDRGRPGGTPLSFLQAAAFQWVNPKGWAMAITAVAAYAPGATVWAFALVAGVFVLVNLPSVGVWTVLGVNLRRILTSPRRLRAFNLTMAGLLLASLWPVLAA